MTRQAILIALRFFFQIRLEIPDACEDVVVESRFALAALGDVQKVLAYWYRLLCRQLNIRKMLDRQGSCRQCGPCAHRQWSLDGTISKRLNCGLNDMAETSDRERSASRNFGC
jgi:hypothetical protein